MIADGNGIPFAVITTGGNVPDISKAVDLLDAVSPVTADGSPPCSWTRDTTAPASGALAVAFLRC